MAHVGSSMQADATLGTPTDDSPLVILLVEDDDAEAAVIETALQQGAQSPFELVRARTLSQVLTVLEKRRPDIILADLGLPDSGGLQTLEAVLPIGGDAPIVVLTGTSERQVALDAVRRGAQDYQFKDRVEPEMLWRTIRHAIERKLFERNNRQFVVTRKFVRRLLRDLAAAGTTDALRRELGRSLAGETEDSSFEQLVASFESMGLGVLRVTRADETRWEVEGRDLIERTPTSGHSTCYLALGYLEGSLARVTGQVALGSETKCQSQGHAVCAFALRLQ